MAPERPSPENKSGVAVAHIFSLNSHLMHIKEGDGAIQVERNGAEDDDLTSLSWLVQNKNLLKGINLKPAAPQTSPTSDFAEDGSSGSDRSERGDSTCSSGIGPTGSSSMSAAAPLTSGTPSRYSTQLKHPHHIPYDPLIHINSKPPYSFSCLIFMAIEDSPARALPVKEIYAWIQSHFPFYRNAPTGWKNSVRHNLSLNKCFCKVEKAPNLGKGSLWMVDPAFRPNLLQSMSKAPVNSLSFLERCASNNASPLEMDARLNGSPSKSNGTSNKSIGKLSRLPNPELFPFLSRRLAASGVELPGVVSSGRYGTDSEEDDDEADDVDAATAILTLKHGPRMILPKTDDMYKRSKLDKYGRKVNRAPRTRKTSVPVPVITSSPSEDHTYSAGPNMSPDEAFVEGSDTDDGTEITPGHPSMPEDAVQSDSEEQRRIAEGAADALLNLAGFRVKRNPSTDSGRGRYRPASLSDLPPSNSPTPVKRIRRQRRLSSSSDTAPRQLLRSNRKREALALEQEILDRKSIRKAEIMADLEVIRNNNNNNNSSSNNNNNNLNCIDAPKDVVSSGPLNTSPSRSVIKVRDKRHLMPSWKQKLDLTEQLEPGDPIVYVTYDKKVHTSQKRKHWSVVENHSRKGRR